MRQYLMNGGFFIGASIGTTLAKLSLRYLSLNDDVVSQNKFFAEAMLIIASILHLGKSGLSHHCYQTCISVSNLGLSQALQRWLAGLSHGVKELLGLNC